MAAKLIALLHAWFGDAAASRADRGYALLPRRDPGRDYSLYAMQAAMRRGEVEGLFVLGENPAVSQANTRLLLESLSRLRQLVVVDLFETETAAFFRLEGLQPETIDTEVIVLPAAAFLEKPGSLTNSGRWVQWRESCVPGPGEARPDLWILDQLARRLRVATADHACGEALARSTWSCGADGLDYEAVLREIGGRALAPITSASGAAIATGEPLAASADAAQVDRAACGNALYAGVFRGSDGRAVNRTRGRDGADPSGLGVHPGFAWSWPDNTRVLYNRGSADGDGQPRDPDRALTWWDAEAGEWRGHTTPFVVDRAAAPDSAAGGVVFPGPAEQRGRLFVGPFERRAADGSLVCRSPVLADGPLPEHHEPVEGRFQNPLREGGSAPPHNPTVRYPHFDDQPPLGDPAEFPHVLTTGFLHEMWGGGAMSRRLGPLVECQPEPFVEISPRARRGARRRQQRARARVHGARRGGGARVGDGAHAAGRGRRPAARGGVGADALRRVGRGHRRVDQPADARRARAQRRDPREQGVPVPGRARVRRGGEPLVRFQQQHDRVAMMLDLSVCIGCRACQVACKEWNELPLEPTALDGSYQNPPRLSGETWKQVKFRRGHHARRRTGVVVLLGLVQALRGRAVPRSVSDRRDPAQ